MSAEKVTYRQIEEQQNNGHMASVLVERSDKSISVGTYAGESKGRPGEYDVIVDGGVNVRREPASNLTDERQAELAEQLAGMTVVRGIGSGALKGLELEAHAVTDGAASELAESESAPDVFAGFKEELIMYADELISSRKTDPHTSASLLSRMISGREYDSKFTPEQRVGLKRVGDYLFSAVLESHSPSARYVTHEQLVGKARDMLRGL